MKKLKLHDKVITRDGFMGVVEEIDGDEYYVRLTIDEDYTEVYSYTSTGLYWRNHWNIPHDKDLLIPNKKYKRKLPEWF